VTEPRPKALSIQWDNIPRELVLLPRWVCWRHELVRNKWTKVPRQVGGKNADATDPTTWANFGSVRKVIEAGAIDFDGVGIVFAASDEYAGIDLDGCIDEAGAVAPEAMALITKLNSYTEVSPSGTGVKIWVKARLPEGCRHSSTKVKGFKKIEFYDRSRYFAMTGWPLPGMPVRIEPRQAELDAVYTEIFPAKPDAPPTAGMFREAIAAAASSSGGFNGSDEELLEAARGSRNGSKFVALFDQGDLTQYNGDHSDADMALCGLLAFWTGPDPARIERLFSMSKLGQRDKWLTRQNYRERTIAKALEGKTEFYNGNGLHKRAAALPEPGLAPQGASGAPAAAASEPEIDAASDGPVRLGEHDPETGRIVLSPNRTLPTADAFVREFHTHPDRRTLLTYASLVMRWRQNRYVEVEDGSIRQQLHPWLHAALRYARPIGDRPTKLIPFDSNPRTVNAALETIKAYTHTESGLTPPCWLEGGGGRPPALELLPCRSATLHVPTGQILAPTPLLFTTNAIAFDYDPSAPPPEAWLAFLGELWGDDAESVQLLQEYMGYCLIADTSQQKMLMLVGPRRSGKGTMGESSFRWQGRTTSSGRRAAAWRGPSGSRG
jgi:hypothetical protein